ncbi:MAG: alpha/beta hydrolase, partial [Holophagales bacterium]|nr:alpha/beta hydrolase [Holophagales bacterium]
MGGVYGVMHRESPFLPAQARAMRPVAALVIGFVVGGLESHDDVCAEICAGCNVEVVSVDYRLSPEHAHPAAY